MSRPVKCWLIAKNTFVIAEVAAKGKKWKNPAILTIAGDPEVRTFSNGLPDQIKDEKVTMPPGPGMFWTTISDGATVHDEWETWRDALPTS